MKSEDQAADAREVGMTRRDLAWTISRAATVAGGQAFFRDWLRAAETHANGSVSQAPPEPDRWSAYTPQFFSASEYRTLENFSSILIPTDDTPGAKEAHVAQFIDFVVNAAAEYASEMQHEWRAAMAWLEKNHFGQLTPAQQLELVQHMAAPEAAQSEDEKATSDEGFNVYRLMKDHTVRAFYTSRVGLIDVLEYEGNAYLTEFPGCAQHGHEHV
jgi:hypothetical protein